MYTRVKCKGLIVFLYVCVSMHVYTCVHMCLSTYFKFYSLNIYHFCDRQNKGSSWGIILKVPTAIIFRFWFLKIYLTTMFQKMWYQNLRLSRLSICLNDISASCLFQYFLFSFRIFPYFLLEYSHIHISKHYLFFWILWGVRDEN